MKAKFVVYPLAFSFFGNLAFAGENKIQVSPMQAEEIADFLGSMNRDSRERLASKLYYLDPKAEKNETKKTLLDELIKQGRVKKDDIYETGPRTVSTESGI